MTERKRDQNQLVINYLYLRKTVGWIGTLLPIVLIAGNAMFFTTALPDSMSSYYYTNMRNVFVGSLCALGVFLIAYAGYDDWDRWITNIAGLGAIGVAFCATKPTVCGAHARTCVAPAVRTLSTEQNVVGTIHLVFAAIAFIALGVMALRFAKLPPSEELRPRGFGDLAPAPGLGAADLHRRRPPRTRQPGRPTDRYGQASGQHDAAGQPCTASAVWSIATLTRDRVRSRAPMSPSRCSPSQPAPSGRPSSSSALRSR